MTRLDPPGKDYDLSPVVFADIRSREIRRFRESLDHARANLIDRKIKDNVPANSKYYQELEKAHLLLDWIIEELIGNLPLIREKERGRYRWEIYVRGLRFLSQSFRKSYLLEAVFPLLGIQDIGSYLYAFSGKCLEVLNDISKCFGQVETYAVNYASAVSRISSIGKKEDRLCMRYANLKTWELAEDFDAFSTSLGRAVSGSIEIFVEGPIKLYLLLGKDKFLFILRALVVERLREIKEVDEHLIDSLSLLSALTDLVEKSGLLKACRELLPEVVSVHVQAWKEEHGNIRRELPTRELQRLFIERFESGVLFHS